MPRFDSTLGILRRTLDVLCVGELLVDMIATDYGNLAERDAFGRYAGGSPANITANAGRLGVRTALAAAVGADGFGEYLIADLAAAGIDTSLVQRQDAPTSLVVLSRSRGTPTPIFYRGADYRIALTPALEAAARTCSALHFSAWPLSAQPARSSLVSLVRSAREAGALVCFDPNYHSSLWPDRGEAVSFLERLLPSVDIVKPSEDDAERLFGPGEPGRQMDRYLEAGAKVVVMTLGKEGAVATDGSETREYPTLAGEVVDATGAGDAFWAGLYAGIFAGRSLDGAIRDGMAVCAIKLRSVGAAVPEIPLAEIEREFGLS